MNAPEIKRLPIDEHWLERRRKYLNASVIACLFGLHPYKTLARLVAEMRGTVESDVDPDSALIRRGHALEDDAKDEIQKLRQHWRISRCEHQYVDEHARIAATPDYLVEAPDRDGVGSLQIKVVASSVFRRKWTDETPPMGYLLQVATEMMLMGASWGAIGALEIGEFTYQGHIFEVTRHRSAEIRLRTAAAEFWRAYDADEIPAIDFERDGDLIALMFPNETPGKLIDLSTDNAIGDLLQTREILKDTEKDVKKRLKTCEDTIKAKLGDAEGALVPGWRVTLKTQNNAGYTVEPFSFRALRVRRLEQESKPEGEATA
jgi:predicted phage-related endonuclease